MLRHMATAGRWLIGTVLLSGCEAPAMSPEAAPFDALFEAVRTVSLEQNDTTSIGYINDVTTWNGDIAIVDGMNDDVKVYRPDGTLRMTLGRSGKGPGEFLTPFAAAQHGDGGLAVYSDGVVALFDSTGGLVSSFVAKGALSGGMRSFPDGHFVLAGTRIDDGGLIRGERKRVHLYDPRGRAVASYVRNDSLPTPRAMMFNRSRLAVIGSHVVSGVYLTNRISVVDIAGGHEQSFIVQEGYYTPPDWGTLPTGGNGAMQWANQQMWMMRIAALNDEHFIVGFGTYMDGAGARYRYSVVTLAGHEACVAEPVEIALYEAGPNALYGVVTDSNGGARVHTLRPRVSSPCFVRSGS